MNHTQPVFRRGALLAVAFALSCLLLPVTELSAEDKVILSTLGFESLTVEVP